MVISLSAYAIPATATLTISNGTLNYDASGDGTGSIYDGIFGEDDWTYTGSFDFSTSLTGTPPAFSENANWFLSAEGWYEFGWVDVQGNAGDGGDAGSIGPISLGYGSADDLFGAGITDYSDILPAIGMALSSTPTLTDVILAVNAILDPSIAASIPLPSMITDISDFIWVSLSGNTVSYVSNLGLTIGSTGLAASMGVANFGGSLTLTAVPEPGTLGLLGLGLIGIGLIARRKRLAA